MQIHHIRENYTKSSLSETDVKDNPIEQVEKWLNEAIESEVLEPTAFTLCTMAKNNFPAGRIVLLKYVKKDGFIFFSNYSSNKGQQLAENGKAGMVFFWPELQRQITIQGTVVKTSEEISDDYFYSRPIESQLGALASQQSRVINSRKELEEKIELIENSATKIIRPVYWGGYKIIPHRIEFWQGRANRLHDRILFSLTDGKWVKSRLSP